MFIIISNEGEGSSRSAAGVLNPTVLKRYTMSWRGKEFFDQAIITYSLFEKAYNTSIFNKAPINYYFNRLSDHNNWAVASQKKRLNHFLSQSIINWSVLMGLFFIIATEAKKKQITTVLSKVAFILFIT